MLKSPFILTHSNGGVLVTASTFGNTLWSSKKIVIIPSALEKLGFCKFITVDCQEPPWQKWPNSNKLEFCLVENLLPVAGFIGFLIQGIQEGKEPGTKSAK